MRRGARAVPFGPLRCPSREAAPPSPPSPVSTVASPSRGQVGAALWRHRARTHTWATEFTDFFSYFAAPARSFFNSYDALGLVASLNPIASGGSERPLGARVESEEPEEGAEASTSSQPAAPASAARAVPKGYGKIIRDAAGNVVDVVIADEEEEEEDAAVAAGEGGLEEVADPSGDAQLASWVGLGAGHTRRGEGAGGSEGVVEGELAEVIGFGWPAGVAGGCDGAVGRPPIGASRPPVTPRFPFPAGCTGSLGAIALTCLPGRGASVGAAVGDAGRPGAAAHVQGRAGGAAGVGQQARRRPGGDGARPEAERRPADGRGAGAGDPQGGRVRGGRGHGWVAGRRHMGHGGAGEGASPAWPGGGGSGGRGPKVAVLGWKEIEGVGCGEGTLTEARVSRLASACAIGSG